MINNSWSYDGFSDFFFRNDYTFLMITCFPHPGELPLLIDPSLYTLNIAGHMPISDVTVPHVCPDGLKIVGSFHQSHFGDMHIWVRLLRPGTNLSITDKSALWCIVVPRIFIGLPLTRHSNILGVKHSQHLPGMTVVLISAISTSADQEALIHYSDWGCIYVLGISTWTIVWTRWNWK